MEEAARAAATLGRIVTLGIKPATPSSAYGSIRPGDTLQGAVRELAAFEEKPEPALAQRHVAAGYLWNSGNFFAPAKILVEELQRFAPDILEGAAEGLSGVQPRGGAFLLGPGFSQSPKRSFDFAVMEHTRKAAVIPLDLAWSDLGAWDAVHAARKVDENGNSSLGAVVARRSSGNLLEAAPGMIVAVTGISGLAVIAEHDAVRVTPLDKGQDVKEPPGDLKSCNVPQVDIPAPTPGSLSQAATSPTASLFGTVLPAWMAFGLDHAGGGMADMLDHAGCRQRVSRRACVQPRQAYSYARARMMGWPGPADLVVRSSLDSMMRHFRREDGRYRTLILADGTVDDARAFLYDQASVLLAHAHAGPALPDPEQEALALLDCIEATWAHPHGGFSETGGRYLSNPLMHLFQAALAWRANGSSPRWITLADQLAALALTHPSGDGSGMIGEFYGPDWRVAGGPDGDRTEPGHQSEWAWLLVRYSRLRKDENALELARWLCRAGLAGVDPARGVAVDAIGRDGRLLDRTARLWPQTEWLKAALILLEEASEPTVRAALTADALGAVRAVRRYSPEVLRGFWHDRMDPSGHLEPCPFSGKFSVPLGRGHRATGRNRPACQ